MHQATSSYDCCALAWQNPRSDGVCLPFSLVTFFWAAKESDSPKALNKTTLNPNQSLIQRKRLQY
jgi:hypothetical protein